MESGANSKVPNPDEEDSDDDLAYENIQFQVVSQKAQPPRRYVRTQLNVLVTKLQLLISRAHTFVKRIAKPVTLVRNNRFPC